MLDHFVDISHSHFVRRSIVALIFFLILFYGIVPQLKNFGLGFGFHWPHHWQDIYLAIALLVLSFGVAGFNYWLLALGKLRYGNLLLVQVASVIPSKLLPSGFGAMGTNYLYFHSHGFSSGAAGLASSMNNLVGAVVNLLLLGVLVSVAGETLGLGKVYQFNWYDAVLGLLAVLVVLSVGYVVSGHIHRLTRLHGQIQGAFVHYRRHWVYVLLLVLSAACLAIVNVLVFWFSLRAYSVHLSWIAAYLIFSLSIAIGTAIPTPGGLGGVEAGLVAGLLALHVPVGSAIGGVLAFRLISFWLPIIPGILGVVTVERRHMISWKTVSAFLH